MHEFFPNDYDYQEKINLWNERRLSPAWINAGLNKTQTTSPSKPSIPRPWPLEQRNQNETAKNGQTVAS
ncbi:hypothetical protein EBZ39_11855 [bacterium]|nr:hypothetical protein [bacterium]